LKRFDLEITTCGRQASLRREDLRGRTRRERKQGSVSEKSSVLGIRGTAQGEGEGREGRTRRRMFIPEAELREERARARERSITKKKKEGKQG
jgi:hypothetical protein